MSSSSSAVSGSIRAMRAQMIAPLLDDFENAEIFAGLQKFLVITKPLKTRSSLLTDDEARELVNNERDPITQQIFRSIIGFLCGTRSYDVFLVTPPTFQNLLRSLRKAVKEELANLSSTIADVSETSDAPADVASSSTTHSNPKANFFNYVNDNFHGFAIYMEVFAKELNISPSESRALLSIKDISPKNPSSELIDGMEAFLVQDIDELRRYLAKIQGTLKDSAEHAWFVTIIEDSIRLFDIAFSAASLASTTSAVTLADAATPPTGKTSGGAGNSSYFAQTPYVSAHPTASLGDFNQYLGRALRVDLTGDQKANFMQLMYDPEIIVNDPPILSSGDMVAPPGAARTALSCLREPERALLKFMLTVEIHCVQNHRDFPMGWRGLMLSLIAKQNNSAVISPERLAEQLSSIATYAHNFLIDSNREFTTHIRSFIRGYLEDNQDLARICQRDANIAREFILTKEARQLVVEIRYGGGFTTDTESLAEAIESGDLNRIVNAINEYRTTFSYLSQSLSLWKVNELLEKYIDSMAGVMERLTAGIASVGLVKIAAVMTPEDERKVDVIFRLVSGKLITLSCRFNEPFSEIKARLEAYEGISFRSIILGGRKLADTDTPKSSGAQDESVLQLVGGVQHSTMVSLKIRSEIVTFKVHPDITFARLRDIMKADERVQKIYPGVNLNLVPITFFNQGYSIMADPLKVSENPNCAMLVPGYNTESVKVLFRPFGGGRECYFDCLLDEPFSSVKRRFADTFHQVITRGICEGRVIKDTETALDGSWMLAEKIHLVSVPSHAVAPITRGGASGLSQATTAAAPLTPETATLKTKEVAEQMLQPTAFDVSTYQPKRKFIHFFAQSSASKTMESAIPGCRFDRLIHLTAEEIEQADDTFLQELGRYYSCEKEDAIPLWDYSSEEERIAMLENLFHESSHSGLSGTRS